MKSQRDDVVLEELSEARQKLEKAGIRPTQQRLTLCATLFRQGQRHVTAETLRREMYQSSIPVSLGAIAESW